MVDGPGLTWQGQQRLKVSTLGDAGAVFGAGVPQVLKLPEGDDDAPRHGGDLPVVVDQRRPGDQPADDAHDEARGFQSCRHDGGVSTDSGGEGERSLCLLRVFVAKLTSGCGGRTLTCRGAIKEPLPVAPHTVVAATPTDTMFGEMRMKLLIDTCGAEDEARRRDFPSSEL